MSISEADEPPRPFTGKSPSPPSSWLFDSWVLMLSGLPVISSTSGQIRQYKISENIVTSLSHHLNYIIRLDHGGFRLRTHVCATGWCDRYAANSILSQTCTESSLPTKSLCRVDHGHTFAHNVSYKFWRIEPWPISPWNGNGCSTGMSNMPQPVSGDFKFASGDCSFELHRLTNAQ